MPNWTRSGTHLRFLLFAVFTLVLYGGALMRLAKLSFHDELVSHVLLIPALSGYLIWLQWKRWDGTGGGIRWPGAVLGGCAIAIWAISFSQTVLSLPLQILSLCVFLWSGGFLLLGSRFMRTFMFPSLFLLFMIPLPSAIVGMFETFLQHTSADAAYWLLKLSGVAVLRKGLVFYMPGLTIEVAPECSGIHSTYALLMTSLFAGDLFLQKGWTRLLMSAIVIPLGIVRNGFRILVLSLLCVYVDPGYIDSPIHHQGGPLFFALSLIPFALILMGLRKMESRLAYHGSRVT